MFDFQNDTAGEPFVVPAEYSLPPVITDRQMDAAKRVFDYILAICLLLHWLFLLFFWLF